MDFGRSLGYMFDDEKGVNKLLIGGLISMVPVLNWAAKGYSLRTLKRVAEGDVRPLPDWDDLGGDLVKGLLVWVAELIYGLPLLVILLPLIGLMVTGIVGSGSHSSGLEAISGMLGLSLVGLGCLAIPYGLLLAVWMPAATANYALAGDFGAFFRFREIWALVQRNMGNYIVALLLYFVIAQVAASIGSLVLIVGAAFAMFWSSLVLAHLLGQVARGEGPSQGTAGTPAPAL